MDDDRQPTASVDEAVVAALKRASALIQTLPAVERRMASMAAQGTPVWEIAQEMRVSEAAVWRTINSVVATVSGETVTPVETGGLGADTDPGVTGGYGDTGFGALDTEPIGYNDEPEEGEFRDPETAGGGP